MSAASADRLSVIMPVRNEVAGLRGVIGALTAVLDETGLPYELLLIDDHSIDGSIQECRALANEHARIRSIECVDGQPGYGLTVRKGLECVSGGSVVIVMSDGSDEPQDVVKIWRELAAGSPVVYGSRFMVGSNVVGYAPLKLILNRLGNWLLMALFRISNSDITNALKGYHMSVISAIGPLEAEGFDLTAELPLKAARCGFSYSAVPVRWTERRTGRSKHRLVPTCRHYLRTALRIWCCYRPRVKS